MEPGRDPHEATHRIVLLNAARWSPDDGDTRSRRYYVTAIAVVLGAIAIVLTAAQVVPDDPPTTTTVPPLTFPSSAP